ncbi:T3SS effector NleG family protein [Escherichia albertii]|uniref:T3SS effector NleG family protein n=1 Tax=Escherichia albertii TaxID=208962 RepID=UPI00211A4E72|nr:T3SS effector NleG family protein [Escherichia albertii]UUK97447.1 T3SS effector NleG family protein [Escherichia albertii]
MPGLVSYISSTPFANEMAELRQQVMEGQIGGFLLGGERVRISYISDTGRFLAESEGQGQVYAELLNIGFNDGVDALRNRMLSVLSGMGGGNDSPHPLTREPITASIIIKPEECIYDSIRGNFVIKDT